MLEKKSSYELGPGRKDPPLTCAIARGWSMADEEAQGGAWPFVVSLVVAVRMD
jgi:hypothetical protein